MVNSLDFEIRLEGKKGGYVAIHAKSDTNKRAQHIEAAQILADKGHVVLLMPEIHFRDVEDRAFFFPELSNTKNPDIRLNGLLGDFKIPDRKIVNREVAARCVTTTAIKEVPVCVIALLSKEYTVKEILLGIKGALTNPEHNPSIKEVWVIFNDKSILRIPRGLVNNKVFYRLAETL
jgi:hypothetical protein